MIVLVLFFEEPLRYFPIVVLLSYIAFNLVCEFFLCILTVLATFAFWL